MITIRDTASVDQLGQVELQQLIRDRIAEITQGQPYDADVYGEFVIVEVGDTMPEIEAHLGREVVGNFEWLVEWPCWRVSWILCKRVSFTAAASGLQTG